MNMQQMWKWSFVAVLLATLAVPGAAFCKARPGHKHEDFLNEKDLWIGVKGGVQVTSYSSVENDNRSLREIPAKVGYFGGPALQLVYDLPRIEVDLFGNARGGLYYGSWVYSLAVPVLLKFPVEIEEGADFVMGLGFQSDFTIGGLANLRPTLVAPLASVGATVDLYPVTIEFDVRYLYGIRNYSRSIHGGKPQDLQFLFGAFWHL